MSRWIDADTLEPIILWQDYEGYVTAYSDAEIENAPSIDIVRCKECEHGTYCEEAEMYICSANDQDLYEAEHFCSYGERRE